MTDETPEELSPAARRLCSEIQLFDLCDLDSCRFRSSRFCTNDELITKFESIKEDDDNRNTLLYEEDEIDDEIDSDSDFDDSDDSFDKDDESF